ncbi:erythromycin esterase family protein [Acuticoccus sediminis]|uniref:erythromycin esterase family protein n=1 Tax=Acuticoccus sediminis TaxID=2184697 RepID=UPI001CFE1BD2|nr:erythromycin esterase family protein [Acuticoccus sediminis]
MHAHDRLIDDLRSQAIPLADEAALARLVAMAADARFVLIGEATRGTREFFDIRAEVTRRLIRDHGFAGVAVEASWPDAYRVNRYVRGDMVIHDADDALADFERFPTWTWRNTVVRDFVEWLRDHNVAFTEPEWKAGFYGLDLFSLEASIEAAAAYLDGVDPAAALRAQAYYGNFEFHHARHRRQCGFETMLGVSPWHDQELMSQLLALRSGHFRYLARSGFAVREACYCAEQTATATRAAERYYRAMFEERVSPWNLRSQHIANSLERLADHIHVQRGEQPKLVVWAHNCLVGDARATEMGERGERSLGTVLREAHGRDAVLIGFSTHDGTVRAASAWDEPGEVKPVRAAVAESYERLFHVVLEGDALIPLRDNEILHCHFSLPRLQRAIGALETPQGERKSEYFHARLADQFDAVIHVDHSHALEPLDHICPRHPDYVAPAFRARA